MEPVAIAVVFGIMLGVCVFLDEKRREMARELNGIYEELSRYNSRANGVEAVQAATISSISSMEKALPGLTKLANDLAKDGKDLAERNTDLEKRLQDLTDQMRELTEQVKVTDRQERAVLEGMSSILNYNLDVARKAVSGHAEE